MNKEQIVGLVIRLFAVFLVVYSLRLMSSLFTFATVEPIDYISSAIIFLFGFSPILIAIILWRFPLAIASKLIPKPTETKHTSAWGETEIQIVAFSTLGLWVLSSAIPNAFYWVTLVNRIKSVSFGNTSLSPENVAGIVSTITQIILGFWLLMGSKGIVGLVRKLRHAGG